MSLLKNLFNLNDGEEKQEIVLENVRNNISFRGSNLWILACAIFIASIGLNVNSTAVIIGAMLISPLMGPIVGIGFAIATYNMSLFKQSAKNLILATVVSLLVSSLYFFISPFKEAQSELLARTTPNIYDVLIAFIGGVVGAISITRVEKGNPIPGVAIATALMPPLCTAGFGIATFNLKFFAGALYLYFINCFFIATSTFLIIKYLKYKPLVTKDEKFDKKVRNYISFVGFIMIVPSIFLAYQLINERKYTQDVEDFIRKEFVENGHTVIYKKINASTDQKNVEIAFLNHSIDSTEIQRLNKKLDEKYNIKNTKLIIKDNSPNLKNEILAEINQQNKNFSEKDIIIQNLTTELGEYKINDDKQLVQEVKIIFPEIETLSIGKLKTYSKDTATMENVVLYKTSENIDKDKLRKWLKTKLNNSNLKLINSN